jgi:hypothetical protein
MDNALCGGFVEFANGDFEFRLQLIGRSGSRHLFELLDVRPDGALDGAVSQPALLILSHVFLGATRMRHGFLPHLFQQKKLS